MIGEFTTTCRGCHEVQAGRLMRNDDVIAFPRYGAGSAFKFAHLRSAAEKLGMDLQSTNSRAGFGLVSDGRVDTLTRFFGEGFPTSVFTRGQLLADMVALLLCFSGSDLPRFGFPFPPPDSPSQDVPAATGRQVTLLSSNVPPHRNQAADGTAAIVTAATGNPGITPGCRGPV